MITAEMERSRATRSSPSGYSDNSSATASFESLVQTLRGFMSSVKVTNPIARQDPDTAIAEMAAACLNFPPWAIQAAVEDFKTDLESCWPTVGAMTAAITSKLRERRRSAGGTMPTNARPHAANVPINGWTYGEIMELTEQGVSAKRGGKPHSFLMELVNGHRELPPEMACDPNVVRHRKKSPKGRSHA